MLIGEAANTNFCLTLPRFIARYPLHYRCDSPNKKKRKKKGFRQFTGKLKCKFSSICSLNHKLVMILVDHKFYSEGGNYSIRKDKFAFQKLLGPS